MRRLAVLVTVAAAVLVGAAPASAIDDSKGTAGFCPDDDGVTVVVDFGAIGGDVIVRCAPGSKERNGFEALQDAGFEIEGTSRFGSGAVCRIEGRPGADEGLDVEGNGDYRESCVDMPPASAYWSYWGADNGGDWSYSQWGLQNREAINGGFEGWSFALNETRQSPSAPRIDPVRPESADDEPQTESDARDERGAADRSSDSGGDKDADSGEEKSADSADDLPMPKQRDTGTAPSSGSQDGVRWSGGEDADQVAHTDDDASSAAPWAAAGVIAGLGVLIAVTTVRRRARGNG